MRSVILMLFAAILPAFGVNACNNTNLGNGITCVQSKTCNTIGPSVSCVFDNPTSASNTIISACYAYNHVTFTVADNLNAGSYPQDKYLESGGSGNLYNVSVNHQLIGTAGTTTVTCTPSLVDYLVFDVYEISGLATSSVVDGVASAPYGPNTQSVSVAGSTITSTGTSGSVLPFIPEWIGSIPSIGGSTCGTISSVTDYAHFVDSSGSCSGTTFTMNAYQIVGVGPITTTTNGLLFVSNLRGNETSTWTVGTGFTRGEVTSTPAVVITGGEELMSTSSAGAYVGKWSYSTAATDAAIVMVAYKAAASVSSGRKHRSRPF